MARLSEEMPGAKRRIFPCLVCGNPEGLKINKPWVIEFLCCSGDWTDRKMNRYVDRCVQEAFPTWDEKTGRFTAPPS